MSSKPPIKQQHNHKNTSVHSMFTDMFEKNGPLCRSARNLATGITD